MPDKLTTSFFELGKLYAEKTNFLKAIPQLIKAKDLAYKQKNFADYSDSLSYLTRIYIEQNNIKKLEETHFELNKIFNDDSIETPASVYYFLAFYYSHEKKYNLALKTLEDGLSIAMKSKNKKNICLCFSGLANIYYQLNKFEEALKQIDNLRILLKTLGLPQIKSSADLINGIILRDQNQPEEALNIFWQAYESIKINKDIYLYIQLLFHIGITYKKLNDNNLARVYLTLANKIVDSKNLNLLAQAIEKHLKQLESTSQFDLVFNQKENSVVEQNRGTIQFNNQFILIDLLKVFLQHPGQVYSKEVLVKMVWKQNYDPLLHDNKVYVTIKRLRELIEPDGNKSKYLFRSKNGYYLSKSTRVSLI